MRQSRFPRDRDNPFAGGVKGVVTQQEYSLSTKPLHHAVSEGDTERVLGLLGSETNIEAVDRFGITPLLVASAHGHVEVAKALLDSGANVNNKRIPYTALHVAAVEGHAEVVELLVASGADTDIPGYRNYTPLHLAARHGHIDIVRHLLSSGAEIDPLSKRGTTPLARASDMGELEVVRHLLAAGADPDGRADGDEVKTPLAMAAEQGNKDVAEVLLAAGAGVNVGSRGGQTPIFRAVEKGHDELVSLLLAEGADPDGRADGDKAKTPLAMAAELGHKEVAEALLAAGAGVNVRSENGRTPIFWAVEEGHNELVSLLLAAGAEVDHVDNETGGTPLHFVSLAYSHDDAEKVPETLAILLAAGADPDRKFAYSGHDQFFYGRLAATADRVAMLADGSIKMPGRNEFWARPLYLPLLTLDKEIMRTLLEGGADPDADFHNGAGILHYVVELADSVELAELLLGHGADVDIRDMSGSTPLHYAAYLGLEEMAGFLLESGADPNARNVAGMTPLDYATCLGNDTTHGLLVDHGARPVARDADGVSIDEVCEVLLNGDNGGWVWLESRLGLVPMGLRHLAENELWCYVYVRKPSLTTRIRMIPAKALISLQ